MYCQDSTTNGYQQHPCAYSNAQMSVARSNQPARSLALPTTSPPAQLPTSTTLNRRPLHGYLRFPSQAHIIRTPHTLTMPLPPHTPPTPRRGLRVQNDLKRPITAGNTNGAANERPSLEGGPSLRPRRRRQWPISRSNREHQRPQNSPPPPQPDPNSNVSPNPSDPFSVVGPRGIPLKQTKSNTTDSSHKGSTYAAVSL